MYKNVLMLNNATRKRCNFLAETKQLDEHLFLSVCLSVCLSHLFHCVPVIVCIIMKCSGVITIDKSDVHARGQGQRPKVKVTEVNDQFSRFL